MKFAPGQSGNPQGRPKKEWCLSNILVKISEEKHSVDDRGLVISRIENLMRKVYEIASEGDMAATNFIADRLEGKPKQMIEQAINSRQIPEITMEVAADATSFVPEKENED